MTTTLMIFQAVVSILLIVLVLLQFGKGAEAGLLSGGGESIMTGAQQGNILSKATVILSILFMGNSVLLSKIQSEKASSSLLDSEAPIARPLNTDAMDTKAPVAAPAKTEEEKKEAAPENKEAEKNEAK